MRFFFGPQLWSSVTTIGLSLPSRLFQCRSNSHTLSVFEHRGESTHIIGHRIVIAKIRVYSRHFSSVANNPLSSRQWQGCGQPLWLILRPQISPSVSIVNCHYDSAHTPLTCIITSRIVVSIWWIPITLKRM